MSARAYLIAALAVVIAFLPAASARGERLHHAPQAFGHSIFGVADFGPAEQSMLPQWRRVLARMIDESTTLARCSADETQCTSPAMRAWRRMSSLAAGLDPMGQLRAVNRFFNRWPHKTDRALYGVSEYWATPTEFMLRSGDCEDYAIAKFYALRELGFGNEEMRIVMLYDRQRRIGHVVLAVHVSDDVLILNNQTEAVVSQSRYENYVPWYLLNEIARWRAAVPTLDQIVSGATLRGGTG